MPRKPLMPPKRVEGPPPTATVPILRIDGDLIDRLREDVSKAMRDMMVVRRAVHDFDLRTPEEQRTIINEFMFSAGRLVGTMLRVDEDVLEPLQKGKSL